MGVSWGSPFPFPGDAGVGGGFRPLSRGHRRGGCAGDPERSRRAAPDGSPAQLPVARGWRGGGQFGKSRARGERRVPGQRWRSCSASPELSSAAAGGPGGYLHAPVRRLRSCPRAGSSPVCRAIPAAGPEPLPPPRHPSPPPSAPEEGGSERRVPGDRTGPPRYRSEGPAPVRPARDRSRPARGSRGSARRGGGFGQSGTGRESLNRAAGVEHRPRYRAHGGAQPGPLRGAEGAAPGAGPGLGVPGGTGGHRNNRRYPTRATGCSGRSAPPTGTPPPPSAGPPRYPLTTGGRGGGAARGRREREHRAGGGRRLRASPGHRRRRRGAG